MGQTGCFVVTGKTHLAQERVAYFDATFLIVCSTTAGERTRRMAIANKTCVSGKK